MTDALTIEEYLKGKVGVDIPTETLSSVLFDRHILPNSAVATIPTKSIELAYADLLKSIVVSTPTQTASRTEQDGDWKSSVGSVSYSTPMRKMWRKIANEIYERYGEKPIASNPITIINL